MTKPNTQSFLYDLQKTHAQVMFDHAVNPEQAMYLSTRFGGKGEPVTREDVEARFGTEASQAWQDARDAKARYFASIRDRLYP